MKVYRNEAVERAILAKLWDKMDDPTRGIDGPWHASDLYLCARQRIKEKVDGSPHHDRKTMGRFAFGFAIEDYIFDGDEEKRQEHEGVLFTVDGMAGVDDVLEMKSTAAWMDKFDESALKEKVHWIRRTQAYCAVRGAKRAHVVIWYIHQRDYKAFTVEFTARELADAKAEIPRLRDQLNKWRKRYVETGELPGVETRQYEWECGYCPWRELLGCDKLAESIGMKMPKRTKEKGK